MQKQKKSLRLLRTGLVIFACLYCLHGQGQTITTVAGDGSSGYTADGVAATASGLAHPSGIAADNAGNLYICDENDQRIRKVNTSGTISTIAGTGTEGYSGDGGPAIYADLRDPYGIALDGAGNIYFSDETNNVVRKVDASGTITTVAGYYTAISGYSGEGVAATAARLSGPGDLCFDAAGNLYMADEGNACVRKITAAGGVIDGSCVITTVAGTGGSGGGAAGDGGPATAATLSYALGICFDAYRNLYISDIGNNDIRKVNTSGVISTFAGIGTSSYSGDGGPATAAGLAWPNGLVFDACGNLLFADESNEVIRKIDAAGIINTIAGTGSFGYCCDGGPATAATLYTPEGVCMDGTGNLYVADWGNNRIRKITQPVFGAVTGTTSICVGFATTLSDATTGGTWSSSSTSVATIGPLSGVVTGVSAGSAVISYTVPGICYAATIVNIYLPAAISGPLTACAGSTATLTDATPGGTWGSSDGAIATIAAASGVATGISPGTAIVTYSLAAGCYSTATFTVGGPLPIDVPAAVCAGSAITLTDATGGGTWGSSSNVTAGTGTGVVTGVYAGTASVTYTLPGGCYDSAIVTVNPLPAAIGGPSIICGDAGITLTDGTSGGTWSSGSPGVATIGSSTGVVAGAGRGTAIITYSLATGCFTTVTVDDENPDGIAGGAVTCIGVTIGLGDGTDGGTWSSSNTAVATVGSAGAVTGVSGGTAAISYIMPAGCFAVRVVSVLSPITGPDSMCGSEATITLSDATAGGVWTSTLVTVGSTGIVTSSISGAAIVTYTVYPAGYSYFGCSVLFSVRVIPLPGYISAASGCEGATMTLVGDTTDVVWSSTNTSVATIGSATGLLTGVSAGTTIISYQSSSTSCIDYEVFTVSPLPEVFMVTGGGGYCAGSGGADIGLSGSETGVNYQLYDGGTATGGAVAGTGGALNFGLHPAGTYTVRATSATTGCSADMTGSVTTFVSAGPDAITGASLICPGGTATLSDATAGGVWSSGNTAIGTVNSGGVVTGIAGGVVTISYAVSGCAATYSFTVYPGSGSGACTPCSYFGTAAFTTLGPVISTNLSAGNYYAPASITAYGALTFTDAIIMMAAGDTMYLDTAASLTLDSSHLFSCNMWQGMRLESGSTRSAQLTVTQSTLIEDAMDAVYAPSPVAPAGGGYAVDCDNAVFNRNVTGIDIEYYNSLSSAYPFLIRNTVITGRDFSGYPGYPAAWPGAATLKTAYSDGSVFDPPFKIQNYPGANCKDGQGQYIGINLDSVGTDTPNTYVAPGVALPTYYAEITIGDTTQKGINTYQNLLDNLEYGIYGLNSNMTVVNSAFTNIYNVRSALYLMHDTIRGGDAIYAYATNDAVNHDRLRVYSPGANPYHNLFYGFTSAVACYNYFDVIGQYNYMTNASTGAPVFTLSRGPTGAYGFLVESAKYDTVDISYDTISNVTTGIAFWALEDPQGTIPRYPMPPAPWQYSGLINVSYNVVQASPLGYSSTMAQLLHTGISIQNVLVQGGPVADVSDVAGQVNVNNNYVNDAYDGIFINNFWRQTATAAYNNIYVRPTNVNALQYGINITHSSNSSVQYNQVFGSIGTTDNQRDSMRAYYASSNSKLSIGCNVAQNTGRGYEFFIQNPSTQWYNNTMSSLGKGYVLNGAVIGTQGGPGLTCGNEWAGSWTASFQTYVISAVPTSSTLYLPASGLPINNGSSGGIAISPYRSGYGLQSTTPTREYICRPAYPRYANTDSLYEYMAQQEVPYGYAIMPNNWMGQFKLWEAMLIDSSMADSSTVLAFFQNLAQNSRYAYLTDIETQIAQGNFDSATTMLGYNIDSMANTAYDSGTQVNMADGIAADYIVQNYQQFYTLYMKYIQDTLSGTDSLAIMALAGLCPEENGTVVYQARALYSSIFNNLTTFNDDSCITIDSTYIGERHSNPHGGGVVQNNDGQQYELFPNPNNGTMSLKQTVTDGEPVSVEITDIVGQSVYSNKLLFNGNLSNLQLGTIAPGMYLLQVTDSKNRSFNFKFVVSKF